MGKKNPKPTPNPQLRLCGCRGRVELHASTRKRPLAPGEPPARSSAGSGSELVTEAAAARIFFWHQGGGLVGVKEAAAAIPGTCVTACASAARVVSRPLARTEAPGKGSLGWARARAQRSRRGTGVSVVQVEIFGFNANKSQTRRNCFPGTGKHCMAWRARPACAGTDPGAAAVALRCRLAGAAAATWLYGSAAALFLHLAAHRCPALLGEAAASAAKELLMRSWSFSLLRLAS